VRLKRLQHHLLENVAMTTDKSDWEAVWAEYDARAGAPQFQAHTPWYMDPDYVGGQEAATDEPGRRGRPLLAVASVAVMLLAFMLNIQWVPEAPRQVAAWQPVMQEPAQPVARLTLGATAEAAPAMPATEPVPSEFGTLLSLPAPQWVRADVASPAAEPDKPAAAAHHARRPAAARQRLAAHEARPRSAQARPPARLAAVATLPDRLCAPTPSRAQHAQAPAPRQQNLAAIAAKPAQHAAAAPARAGKAPTASRNAGAGHPAGTLAMAGAARAPPAAARS